MAYDGQLKFDTSMDASGFQKGANKLGDIVKGLGVFKIIEQGMGMVANSIDSAVSRVDTLNKFPAVMERMGYGADNARATMEKLSKGIEGLPTTLDGIVGNAQRLAIATGSLDKGADTALALNNALLASGASSEAAARGSEQYLQALSRNKMETEEWKTLQETMPYALQKTAEAFGFTGTQAIPQLYSALKDGDITMLDFNEKLISLNGGVGGFAEVAQTASGGIATSWSNVQTAVVRGTANVIQAIDLGLEKFGGISGVMDSVKGAVDTAFSAISSGATLLMQNLDILAISAVGVGAAFASYRAIQAWETAAKEAATVSSFLKETHQDLTIAVGNSKASQLEQVAATKLQEAQDARARHEKLELIATEKMNEAATLKEAAAKATGTEATQLQERAAKAAAVAEQAEAAAKAAGTAATTADTVAVQADVAAQNQRNTSVGLGTALIGFLTGSITLHQLATAAATVATNIFSMALKALPLIGIVAAIGAVVAGIIALVKWLSSSSAEYKKQKEEVETLTTAQEELAASTEESADAYKSSTSDIAASAKVSKDLVGTLKAVSSTTASAGEKNRKMSATIDQLNTAVDGLNIAYDEETGEIRNINTGQKISLEQLEQLVSAKSELAQANAWQERANDLVQEQVKIQEDLAVIESKRKEISENDNLSAREKKKLIKELDEAAEGHAATMADVEMRLDIINENLATSSTMAAESIVDDYERMEQAITENGESIDAVAVRWGVSVESIKAAWSDAGGSFDEFVTSQDERLADYQESVKSHSENVINSFKEIPAEYEMSAQEMIEVLRTNRERYAEWKQAMTEISGQVSSETLAELEKLGPGALSAINEMRENGGAGLREFDREIRTLVGDSTGYAIQECNDPAFIAAPARAFSAAAQQVTENTALTTAMTNQMQDAKTSAEAVDFSSVGQDIASDIAAGLNSADVDGAMNGITAAIKSSSGKVTAAISSMSTAVRNTLKALKTQAVNTVNQMMAEIHRAVVSRAGSVRESVASMGSGVSATLAAMKTQAARSAAQMMDEINNAIVSRTGIVCVASASLAHGVVDGLWGMVGGAEDVSNRMMDGILSAMNRKADTLYAKAREIARGIAATMRAALDVHSPSRVMIQIFEDVMWGVYKGMDGMTGALYREAESISDGIAERLSVSPADVNTGLSLIQAAAELQTGHLATVSRDFLARARAISARTAPVSTHHDSSVQQMDRRATAQLQATIEVPVMLDGREIARGTARYTGEQMDFEVM